MSGKTKKVLIGVGVVALLGIVVAASFRGEKRGKGPKVYVEEATRRSIARLVKASGQIDPRVKVNISAHVIGRIERLFVEEGQRVEAGDPFLELEQAAFKAARDQAAAQVAMADSNQRQAQIRLQDQEIKLKRMRRLREEGIASEEQLEQAELARNSAELDLEEAREAVLQARASLEKAQDDLSKATIFAPLSGRVIELNAEEGEVVVSGTMNNPASVIGTIADLSEILAEVDVDETEIAYLELGQAAVLDVDALSDREYTGRVVEIGSSGFQRPQQPDVTFFKVKVLLDDPDPGLRPGMSVRVEINTAEKEDALTIPIQAVVDRPPLDVAEEEGAADDEEIPVVLVVLEDDTLEQRPVETGLSDATHVEVVSGLEEGERVVTGPYRAIKDLEQGDSVRIREEGDEEEGES
ncbi:MAG: efflux RND transporter periplasmic adaptor subunit [Thermoanaerobaculia bacterium]|nr:efflux RND transporter periplasmic adaptor subunit [Thermoanaerobaculia bacterium]